MTSVPTHLKSIRRPAERNNIWCKNQGKTAECDSYFETINTLLAVVSFLKFVVTEVLFSIVAFKTLTFGYIILTGQIAFWNFDELKRGSTVCLGKTAWFNTAAQRAGHFPMISHHYRRTAQLMEFQRTLYTLSKKKTPTANKIAVVPCNRVYVNLRGLFSEFVFICEIKFQFFVFVFGFVFCFRLNTRCR